jgi:TATA-binding protein-associated factor
MQSRQELRSPFRKLVRKFDNFVLISSYEVVRNDLAFFSEFHWNYLILDEGHSIRNAKAKTTLAVKTLRANHRLILSGTPIQNSVLELWSLFDFLMPGFIFFFFTK